MLFILAVDDSTLFRIASNVLTQAESVRLASDHLGLKDVDVDAITTHLQYITLGTIKYQLLIKWAHLNGDEATPTRLLDHLVAMGLGTKRLQEAATILMLSGM